jgi:signal transduction histidine kinase/CheY-like chemotaxis protein
MRENANDHPQVRTEQVRLIYRNYPFTLSANLGLVLLVIAAVWREVATGILLAWGACGVALTTKGAADYMRYRRALFEASPTVVKAAARRFAQVAWCTGVMWGAAGLSPFLVDSTHVHQIVFQAITGMAFGGAAFLSMERRLFYGYTVPLLGLTLLGLLAWAPEGRLVTLGFALALVFGTLAFAHNVNALIHRSLALRFENIELIDALRQQKEQADYANLSKSRFLAAASHDLRQPMHALGLLFESLRPGITDPSSQEVARSIAATIHTLEDLFNALLDISKLDAGVIQSRVEDVALAPLLERIESEFRPLAERKGLRFVMRAPELAVRSDPALLERMLRNLVGNAIQHTPNGTVMVACRSRAGTVHIEVRDSGPGIAPALHRDIFQEFYQVNNQERDRSKGVGLGLAIVDRLGRILGHRVLVRSAPGRGSTFAIELPPGSMAAVAQSAARAAAQAATLGPAGRPQLAALQGRLFAAIDDDAIVLEGMRELFAHWGCELVATAGVDELLERLRADGRVPDLVISDYRLRGGETGAQAIARVAATFGRPMPGILVTGDTAPERLRDATRSGHAVLHKPVRPAKLRALLLHLLDGDPAGAPAASPPESPAPDAP